jgi:hypothetical protein
MPDWSACTGPAFNPWRYSLLRKAMAYGTLQASGADAPVEDDGAAAVLLLNNVG